MRSNTELIYSVLCICMYVCMYVCVWVSAGMNAFMYVGMDFAYICSTVQNYSGPN